MTNFRRSVTFDTQKKAKGGKGGGGWYDQYRLPQGSAAPFALINAEYVDPNPAVERTQTGPDGQLLPVKNSYFKFKQHTRVILKGSKENYLKETCSQGHDPHNPNACAGCTAMDTGDKSVTISDKFALGIVHLVPYHCHPLFDRETGNMKVRQSGQDSGPILTYTECTGRTCNLCKVLEGKAPVLKTNEFFPTYDPSTIATEFGHRRYLEIGKNHLSNLEGWDSAVSSQCGTAINGSQGQFLSRCSNQLTRDSFNCPSCGEVLIDVSQDPRSDQELEAAVLRPYPCLTCKKGVMLKEVVSCTSCDASGRKGTSLSMFDVVLWGKRQGEGTGSQLMLDRFQSMEESQKGLPANILQMLNGKSVTETIKHLGTPFDFDRVFAPREFAEQAKRLQLNVTMNGTAVSPYSAPMPQPMAGVPFKPTMKPNFNK